MVHYTLNLIFEAKILFQPPCFFSLSNSIFYADSESVFIFTKVGAFFHEDFKYVLIFTVVLLFKVLEGFFDRYGRNHENFLFRMLSLYMSIDAEFNADSEYVPDFLVYFIPKGLLGQKPCIWDIFKGFYVFLTEPSRLW